MKIRKLALLAVLTAVALILFTVEAQFPPLAPVPGMKMGLANIVTVFAVFALGPGEGLAVLCCRVFLGSVFAGNFSSILYSGAGGLCAIGVTVLLRRVLTNKQLWVAGALGAMAHSLGQMAMAIAVTLTPGLVIWLPVLLAVSIVTGCLTGLCVQILMNRGEKLWKTYLK